MLGWLLSFDSSGRHPSKQLTTSSTILPLKMQQKEQGCSGTGTRGNGVPTPFSCFALKWVWSCFKMAIFWVRSHTFFVSTTSLRNRFNCKPSLNFLVKFTKTSTDLSSRFVSRPQDYISRLQATHNLRNPELKHLHLLLQPCLHEL